MSRVEIHVVIDDPAPPDVYGIDVALYGIDVTVDGERSHGSRGAGGRIRFATREEKDREVAATVAEIIANRGWPDA